MVQHIKEHPDLETHSPGFQLLNTLNALFIETMPSIPPRRGKRLDTNWGQFGILASLYFAPFMHGSVRPATLTDAWGRIDAVILRFVFGEQEEDVLEEDRERYKLVGDECEVAPTSTISDWHVRGLDRLAELLLSQEQMLSAQKDERSVLLDPSYAEAQDENVIGAESASWLHSMASRLRQVVRYYEGNRRKVWIVSSAIILLLMGWKAIAVYHLARAVQSDVSQLQEIVSADLSIDDLGEVGPLLGRARSDVLRLRRQTATFLWAGRLMGWLPIYGYDLKSAQPLLDFAAGVVVAADEVYQGMLPLWHLQQDEDVHISSSIILDSLVDAKPRLLAAQESIESALAAREVIDEELLSPKTRPLMEKVDPYLGLIGDGIDASIVIPKILGAGDSGLQTYLVLLQNEDELRATGGFITAVASVTLERGEIVAFKVEDSYAVDDYSKIYPAPPWQLYEYMHSPNWVFRDSNWSPDFPTTAKWAEYLYAYSSAHAVDGVIAIDQQAIRILLAALGPLALEGAPEPISADNVIEYMRYARNPDQGAATGDEWFEERKDFMQPMAQALFEKLQNYSSLSLVDLGQAMLKALDERHILVQMDDPEMAALLANRGWDGALHPREGDYLMVVDSNLGFNKVNAAVQSEIHYDVDLSNIETPSAELRLIHRNPTAGEEPCRHAPYDTNDYASLMTRCYWNYSRVYTLANTELLDSTLQFIPSKWMIREELVPAQIDILDDNGLVEESPEGLRAFGTMIVVPLQEQQETSFQFDLPSSVVESDTKGTVHAYKLYVQKQPGTIAVPIMVSIHLPEGFEVVKTIPEGHVLDNVWQAEITLVTDVSFRLEFRLP